MEKKKKDKQEKYYDYAREKQKLALMKSKYEVEYNRPEQAKESKKIISGVISRREKQIQAEQKIRQKERELSKKSLIGKTITGVKGRIDKFGEGVAKVVDRALKTKVTSKRVLKPSQMQVTIPNRPVESTWGNSSTFFKQELEETKQGLFFS